MVDLEEILKRYPDYPLAEPEKQCPQYYQEAEKIGLTKEMRDEYIKMLAKGYTRQNLVEFCESIEASSKS